VPRDLPWVTRQAAKTQNTVKDDKAKKNPAVFSAAMAGPVCLGRQAALNRYRMP